MKRSEMLSKIASVIINYNEAHRQTPREVALEMAETILQVQEEAGMLPPKAPIPRSFRLGAEERIAYHNTNEWEPEDD